MFLIITDASLQTEFIHMIDIGDIDFIDYDEEERFLSDIGYDINHVSWYFSEYLPKVSEFRYDDKEKDVYPIGN